MQVVKHDSRCGYDLMLYPGRVWANGEICQGYEVRVYPTGSEIPCKSGKAVATLADADYCFRRFLANVVK